MTSRRRAMGREEFNLYSTPVEETKPKLVRNSSSNGVRKRKTLASEISLQKRAKKRRKRAKVILGSYKENKRSKSKKATLPTNYDGEWVTESEHSSYSSDAVLFKELQEPESVREAHHVVDDPLNASFLEPRHRENIELEKIDVVVNYEPLQTVSHLPLQINDTDDEEEEFVLREEDETRKYPGRQPRKSVNPKSKCMKWLMDLKSPTASSNILWDDCTRDHPTERSMHIPQPNILRNKNEQNDADSAAEPLGKLWPGLKIPPDMEVTRGTKDKQSKKWTRKYSVYIFPESEDDESELISLREYRRKRKAEKEKMLCSKRFKPRITSIETLTNIRYIKHGENWRIVENPSD
ncbi:uncharacterized protein LOC128880637 [Hylaeus volcanicus]|uniref:uncharacterized protein LOC128880637 n=1 Tax=Hylaeus volcanicus TaxID=313075 RepID=UPI0023B7F4C2|nr:uncharacterized protein LOC128880637 [Hylaeus volcanicus]